MYDHYATSFRIIRNLKHSDTGCFPVNFEKFLRTPFLQNTSGRLLLAHKQYGKPTKVNLCLNKIIEAQ